MTSPAKAITSTLIRMSRFYLLSTRSTSYDIDDQSNIFEGSCMLQAEFKGQCDNVKN